jgi:hypothetical protein
MLDVPKKAVPVGTAAVDQLPAVVKSPEPGVALQVASCARAALGTNAATASSAVVARALAIRQFSRSRVHIAGRPSKTVDTSTTQRSRTLYDRINSGGAVAYSNKQCTGVLSRLQRACSKRATSATTPLPAYDPVLEKGER